MTPIILSLLLNAAAADPPKQLETTPRPIATTRPAMKQLIEDMKLRTPRIPLPELTEEDKKVLGERGTSYESRLRYHYMKVTPTDRPAGGGGGFGLRENDGTLTYAFKVQLFWIVSRMNNCQYCQGHQEGKLLRAGQTEDQIAALDGDWSEFKPEERLAFAFARKFTYQPYLLDDTDIKDLQKHFKDEQILEMILSMAGNNAINRWKEGVGVPQSATGGGGGRDPKAPVDPPMKHTYLTPTSEANAKKVSKVAPITFDEKTGAPTTQTVCRRPDLELRAAVEKKLEEIGTRTPRLPLIEEAKARESVPADYLAGPLPQWVLLLANEAGKARIASQRTADEKGELKPLLKAQASWIIARQDRAWYATSLTKMWLLSLGQTEDQIYALDGNWASFSPTERALFTVAKKLAASPVVLTDVDVAEAVKLAGARDVVQLIQYTTIRASFDRITESVGLRGEK